MFVRDLELNPVNDFTRAEGRLRDERLIATRPLLHAQIEAARLVDLRESVVNCSITIP